MKKKIFAMLMALCMVVCLGNITAYAADATIEASDFANEHTISLEAGDTDGYTYSYTVPADTVGNVKVGIEVTETSGNFSVLVTNTNTYEEDGAVKNSLEEDYEAVVSASAGDEITIRVKEYGTWNNTTSSMEYAALEELVWVGSIGAVGTVDSPDEMVIEYYGTYQAGDVTTVVPGTEGYYYVAEAPVAGTFYMYLTSYATSATDPEIILTVGDKEVKYSESTETKIIMTGRMPEEVTIVAIDVEMFDQVKIQIKDNGTGTEAVDIAWNTVVEEPLGSAGNPYAIDAFESTLTIPAGTAVYYEVPYDYLASAEAVYFESENAYAFVGHPMMGMISPAEDGELVGFIDNLYYNYNGPIFGIMNNTEEDEECTITFTFPLGSDVNPEEIEDTKEHTFLEGDNSYYYYTFTAPENGIITMDVTSNAEWRYSIDNLTTGAWGAFVTSLDEEIVHNVMDVNKGDEILIYVSGAYYDEEVYDNVVAEDTTVKTTVNFVASVGEVMDVEDIDEINSNLWNDEYDDENPVIINVEDDELVDNPVTVIPVDVLLAVKDYNDTCDAEVAIVLMMNEYAWYIDVTEMEATPVPVDLGITFDTDNTAEEKIEAVAEGNEYMTFSIAHTGAFGFNAVLEFFINEEYAGKTAALYWDNAGTLELVGEKFVITEEGIAGFAMDHASDYVLVIEGTAPVVTPNPIVPDTGDSTNFALWFAVLGLGVVAIAGSVVMKKREF